MKRIFSTLASKWPEYLLEILVITVGILGAFALNNWNENRLENLEGREIIRNIRDDIDNTINEFEKLNTIREYVIQSTMILLEIKEIDEVDKQQMDSLISLTFYRPTFNNKLGSINLLFSSGKINLIKNDSIRNLLISLPGEIDDLIEEEVYANEDFHDHFAPLVFRYISFEDMQLQGFGSTLVGKAHKRTYPKTSIRKSDFKGLLNDLEIRNHMALRRNQMYLTNRETLFLIDKLNLLTNLIDQELSQ